MANETEQLILRTARKHFVQNGYSATRMQEIADEAGINKAMLHYYFRSKDKLYQQILEETLDQVIPIFASAIKKEGTFWERLETIVDTYVSTLIEQPEVPMFIMSEISQKRERFVIELKKRSQYFPSVQSFIAQMQQEMQAGNIRPIPPIHLFLNIVGMTVFPFVSKPIFSTIFNVSDENFTELMKQRKEIILEFVKNALRVD